MQTHCSRLMEIISPLFSLSFETSSNAKFFVQCLGLFQQSPSLYTHRSEAIHVDGLMRGRHGVRSISTQSDDGFN